MPLAEVEVLKESSSSAICFEDYQPSHDRQSLEDLAVWCEQFSPIVGVEQTDVPSSLLLDVTGLAPIFGSEARSVELHQPPADLDSLRGNPTRRD